MFSMFWLWTWTADYSITKHLVEPSKHSKVRTYWNYCSHFYTFPPLFCIHCWSISSTLPLLDKKFKVKGRDVNGWNICQYFQSQLDTPSIILKEIIFVSKLHETHSLTMIPKEIFLFQKNMKLKVCWPQNLIAENFLKTKTRTSLDVDNKINNSF